MFHSGPAVWIQNTQLRRQVLLATGLLLWENAEALAQVMCLEIGMPIRLSQPHIAESADQPRTGGKHPCLVFEEAELAAAANRLNFGMFRNSGWPCAGSAAVRDR